MKKKRHKGSKKSKRGQVMLEYVLSVVVFLGAVFLATVLYDAFQSYGNRAMYLIGSEYP
jgi:uncharacterized protein (UPF0333 family)